MAVKKEVIEPLSERLLKLEIERLFDIKAQQDELDKKFEASADKVLATLDPKDVRQYDDLRCFVVQNMNRGVSWKEEARLLAKRLYPTAELFRRYTVSLVRKYPRKPGKAFLKLTVVKGGE